jgi:hypothetical protein
MPPELITDYWRFRRLVSYCIGAYVIVKLRILLRFFILRELAVQNMGKFHMQYMHMYGKTLSEYVPGNKVEVVVVPDSCKIDY